MNLLEFFFIISGIMIFFLALDIARKEKFNALHFFVFLMIGWGLLVFTFFPWVLTWLGKIFGLQRGADVLVYGAIIFTIYMTLLLLSKVESNKNMITHLVRENALEKSSRISYSWDGVILVRVYNEAPVLAQTLWQILDSWHNNILIVDDGSTDESTQIIRSFSEKNPHIVSVRHSINRWWGAALETGLEYVRRYLHVDNIVTFDADGQHDITDIEKFKKATSRYPELGIIFGSRFFHDSDRVDMPFLRRVTLFLGKIFTTLISGSKLSDPHNGFRLIKKSLVDSMKLNSDSMAYASEMIEYISKNKTPYGEVPVTVTYTEYSLNKWQKSSNAIFIWLRVIWEKFFR